jgi:hypothetical protein
MRPEYNLIPEQPLLSKSCFLSLHRILMITPARKNMQAHLPKSLHQFCKRVRKFLETVGSHLMERFQVDQIRVHGLWYFQHRLIRKILARTISFS